MARPAPNDRSRWARDTVLTDGAAAHIRPARPEDGPALVALYDALSQDARYARFFSPMPAERAVEFERLDQLDGRNHFALVMELSHELIAIARYDRTGPGMAEVAFTVRDDQQGRGVGMLLLEYLAVVAREHGIEQFVADTLPTNRKMIEVFRQAGWDVSPELADGSLHVAFAINATPRSQAAIERREHISEANSIAGVLEPASVAVVGPVDGPGSAAALLVRNLVDADFTGALHVVDTGTGTSVDAEEEGSVDTGEPTGRRVPVHRSVTQIEGPVDLALITAPAAEIPTLIAQCGAKGVHSAVIYSPGFAETDSAGVDRQHEVVTIARGHGLRVVGPNCMGVINTAPSVRLHATTAALEARPGNIAFGAQSGVLGIELVRRAARLGLGISSFVSLGNKADVSGNDLVQFWEQDPSTDVILLYLESFGNPAKFARLVRRIARTKPIVALKSGRGGPTDAALPDRAVDALFAQAGVVRVNTLEELFDVAAVLAHQPLPAGRRVAIIGTQGGPNLSTADACREAGLDIARLAETTADALRPLLGRTPSATGPLELPAGTSIETYGRAVGIVLRDDAVDAVVVVAVAPDGARHTDPASTLHAGAGHDGSKPIVACVLGSDPEAPRTGPVPVFAFPESAVRALAHAIGVAAWRQRDPGRVPDTAPFDVEAVRNLVTGALRRGDDGWLSPDETHRVLRAFRIPAVPTSAARDGDEAVAAAQTLGYPVALKAVVPGVPHPADVGGVVLGLADANAVRTTYREFGERFGPVLEGALVQAMVPEGTEVAAGVLLDAQLGPLVRFGLGGPVAELVAEPVLRIAPVTDTDAAEMVREVPGAALLTGYRGSTPVDRRALEDLLMYLGALAECIPEIVEVDLDPVIARNDGAVALDARIRVAPRDRPAPSGLRALRPS